jgi:hypothetical protein
MNLSAQEKLLKRGRQNKDSFGKDKVRKIINDALKNGLQLPECKRPAEADKVDNSK